MSLRSLIGKGWLILAAAPLALAACYEAERVTAPEEVGTSARVALGRLAVSVTCRGDVSRTSLSCERTGSVGTLLGPQFLIVGGQGQFVQITSSSVNYNQGKEEFSFDVTVQNLIAQALGTPDGTTKTGVRVFFHSMPVETGSGSGTITVDNATGVGTFTGSAQPFYLYDEILGENATSGSLQWILGVPKTVDTFAFQVYVAADVPYPNGFVRVTSSPDQVVVGGGVTLSAEVVDVVGRPVPGRTLTWSSPDPSIATVEAATGVVTGQAGGVVDIVAASDGPEAAGSGRVTVIDPAGYDIELRFLTNATQTQRDAFASAVSRWESLITGDLIDIPFNPGPNDCHPDVDEWIDDLLIFVSLVEIDGPGQVLGRAGPCFVRTADTLTVTGIMEFDIADLDQLEAGGQLELVILHEMGHVIGLGSLWEDKGLLSGGSPVLPCAFTNDPDPRYLGAQGIAAYQSLGSTESTVPAANTGGSGTRCGHWRESVFDNELMTGYLNPGANPLSVVTVQSFADVGYAVDPSGADAYSLPPGPAVALPSRGLRLLDDIRRGPIYKVDRQGRLSPYGPTNR